MSFIRKIDVCAAEPVRVSIIGQTIGNLIGEGIEQASTPVQTDGSGNGNPLTIPGMTTFNEGYNLNVNPDGYQGSGVGFNAQGWNLGYIPGPSYGGGGSNAGSSSVGVGTGGLSVATGALPVAMATPNVTNVLAWQPPSISNFTPYTSDAGGSSSAAVSTGGSGGGGYATEPAGAYQVPLVWSNGTGTFSWQGENEVQVNASGTESPTNIPAGQSTITTTNTDGIATYDVPDGATNGIERYYYDAKTGAYIDDLPVIEDGQPRTLADGVTIVQYDQSPSDAANAESNGVDASGDVVVTAPRLWPTAPGWNVVNGQLYITTPDGKKLSPVPAPRGFPASFSSGNPADQHTYYIPVSSALANPSLTAQGLIDHPTPSSQATAATFGGTLNEATPDIVKEGLLGGMETEYGLPSGISLATVFNPVESYLVTDQYGGVGVLNVTLDGHQLWPGYVYRYETPLNPNTGTGAEIINEGQGLGKLQGSNSPVAGQIDRVWVGQSISILNSAHKP